MIKVQLVLSEESEPLLLALRAEGHALKGDSGISLLCASFTVLLRSFAAVMERHPAFIGLLAAPEPGSFQFRLADKAGVGLEYYRGTAEMLIRGITDLSGEFPDQMKIEIIGDNHGT